MSLLLVKESLMRRSITSGITVLALAVLSACGSTELEKQGDGRQDTPALSPAPANASPTQSAASPSADPRLSKVARPCSVVTAAMVNTALSVSYPGSSFHVLNVDGVDVNNPPTIGPSMERNCAYTGTVAGVFGDNPNDPPYSFNLMVTTFVDDQEGSVWTGMEEASSGDKNIPGIGDDAILTDVEMVARKGRIIAKVWSVDDTEEVLDESVMSAILKPAMASLAG